MTGYVDVYADTYLSDVVQSLLNTPEDHGTTYQAIAAMHTKQGDHIIIGQTFGVGEEVAIEWLREATDRGYDTGRPRQGTKNDPGKPRAAPRPRIPVER